jgi:hypothetical protein
MSEAAPEVAAAPEQATPPPPFDPDPDLIGHLEGNRRAIKGYRRAAEKLRDEAQEGLAR